jgi:hypothetical protein
MRLSYLMFLVTILAACDQPPHAGEQGYSCRGFPAPSLCNDGLRCLDSKCVACGGLGETCCSIPAGSLYCNSGACVGAGWEDPGTCAGAGDCGSIGLACCFDDTCPGGGACVSGMCEGAGGDPCQSGKYPHTVNVIAPDCSTSQVTFMTDTSEQAEQCRQKLVAQAGSGEEVCSLDTKPNETAVCKTSINGADQLYLWNCSDQQLALCEAFFCVNGCSWTTGTCP